MSFKLTEVQDESEFPAILELHRAAFERPFNKLWTLLYPELGNSPDARAKALADGIARTISLHKTDPYSHWIKVTDTDSKRVVGAARWIIYTSNPFKGPLVVDCPWWPEGERREFANICMRQFRSPRFEKMQRPHVFLNICYTDPEYRRHGIGRLLMDWGVKRADQLDLIAYVDASDMGKPLYKTYNFKEVDKHHFSAPKTNPSPIWQEMEAALIPYEWWGMVRLPNKGKTHDAI